MVLRECVPYSLRNREQGERNKICPRLLSGLGHDRGTDRNRRASDYPQAYQRDRQTGSSSSSLQCTAVFLFYSGDRPSRPLSKHTNGYPPTSVLLLLCVSKLLVLKLLIKVRLNQGVISPIREVEAISIPEVAIDRRHLTFTFDFRLICHLSIIEQDMHHKGPIGRDARCWRHPLDRVNFYNLCHLGSSTGGFLTQSPIHRQPYKLIHDFFLGHRASFPLTYVLSCSFAWAAMLLYHVSRPVP